MQEERLERLARAAVAVFVPEHEPAEVRDEVVERVKDALWRAWFEGLPNAPLKPRARTPQEPM